MAMPVVSSEVSAPSPVVPAGPLVQIIVNVNQQVNITKLRKTNIVFKGHVTFRLKESVGGVDVVTSQ